MPIFLKEIFVPLYNTRVDDFLESDFKTPDSLRPARVHSVDPSIEPIDITIEKIHVTICPLNRHDKGQYRKLEKLFPVNDLEDDFDKFDFHNAQAAAIFSITENHPDTTYGFETCKSSNSGYELSFLTAFCSALKLYNDCEPHYFRGYHAKDQILINIVTTWPLKEMQGSKLYIGRTEFNEILELCNKIWSFNSKNKGSRAAKIFNIAASYYLLSATQTEYNIIFIFLMIAFEALFKSSDEDSIGRAKSRFGKLIAHSKAEYSNISKFMSENPKNPGCCFMRNSLLHGDEKFSSVNSRTFWQLKKYIRAALIDIMYSVSTGLIDKHDFYKTMDIYVENRFNQLPKNVNSSSSSA